VIAGKGQTVSDIRKWFLDAPLGKGLESIEQAFGFAGYTVGNGNIEAPLQAIVVDLATWILFCLSVALLIGSILVRDK
jgi:hypothetical protein